MEILHFVLAGQGCLRARGQTLREMPLQNEAKMDPARLAHVHDKSPKISLRALFAGLADVRKLTGVDCIQAAADSEW